MNHHPLQNAWPLSVLPHYAEQLCASCMGLILRSLFLLLSVAGALIGSWFVVRALGLTAERATPTGEPTARPVSGGMDIGRLLPPLPLSLADPAEPPPEVDPPSLVFVDSRAKARATVLINGREVGKSPYMGQIRCETNQLVVVELEYPDGTRVTKSAPCAEEIRVTH